MPTKITKKSFQAGMDKDTDPKQVAANKYEDGYNVSLSQDNRDSQVATFYGANKIGTTLVPTATIGGDNTDIHVMGVYEAIYLIGSTVNNQVEEKRALVFIYNTTDNLFSVYAVPESGTTYLQYSSTFTTEEDANILSEGNYFVDCKMYKESGKTYAHFTDGVTEGKKLPLSILTSGKGGTSPYTREEIQLIRTGFRGNISTIAVSSGGDLLNGTYQFALRLFNNTENKYTKFGLLTQPIFVGMDYSTTERSHGGVGFVSTSQIDLTMTFLEDYAAVANPLYTHYQLAVIENINGTNDRQLTVKLLQPEVLSDHVAPYLESYTYDTNKPAKELVSIDEVTVDDAAIKNFRTLEIKNNRLLPANILYHPLEYDNGDPAIGDTTTPLQQSLTTGGGLSTGYRDPDNATNYVGYFRGELYRYGVVYEDKFGNYSKPKILDFSSVTANNTSSGKDFKFPSRSNGKFGTLLGNLEHIQALGLQINSLDNHPTWSVAAHIVRVPRKKKIQFQTPLVPSRLVQPAKAQGDYPAQRSSSLETDIDPLNVEATNPDGSYVPKNFYHILPKNLIRMGEFYGTSGAGGSGSVFMSNVDPSDEFRMTGSDYEGTLQIISSMFETLIFTSTSAADTGITFTHGDGRSITAGDTIGVYITQRIIDSGDAWGSEAAYAPYATGDTITALDYSTYDYNIQIGLA